MSIPRAKITKSPQFSYWRTDCSDYLCQLDGDQRGGLWISYAWRPLNEERWRVHLERVHGVRTVGSLTADDIGKWIEFPLGMDGRIAEVSHHSQEITSVHLDVKIGAFWGHPSTPCRVTEDKP